VQTRSALRLRHRRLEGYGTLIANLAQLGRGFGGVAAVGGPSKPTAGGTYTIILILFMGNLSTAPAKSIDVQLSPKSATVTASDDESHNCNRLKF
jgi:hypothetical protein